MDRRKFITSSACFAATTFSGSRSLSPTVTGRTQSISLRVDLTKPLATLAPAFIGLGCEISSVARPGLFSPQNSTYVQYVRTLGRKGSFELAATRRITPRMQNRRILCLLRRAPMVNEAAIRDLAGFLESAGWQLIWGLNLGKWNPTKRHRGSRRRSCLCQGPTARSRDWK